MQSSTSTYLSYQGGPVQHQSPATQPHHHHHPHHHHSAIYDQDVVSNHSRHHHRDTLPNSYGPPWASASPSLSSYADLSWTSSPGASVTSGPPLPFPPSFSYHGAHSSSSASSSPTSTTPSSSSTLYHPNHQYLMTSSSSRQRADSLPALAQVDTKPVLPRIPTNGDMTQERSRDSRSPPSPTLSATAGNATTSRPYLCPTCPMSFARAHDLKRHRDTHTQERKHCCPYCGKTLSRKDALKRHVLSKQCPAEGGKDGIWPPPPGFVPRIPNAASVISAANAAVSAATGAFGQGRTLPALPTGWPSQHSQSSSSSSLRSASSLRSSSASTSPTSASAPYHIPHRGSGGYPYSDTRHHHAAYSPYA